LRILESRLDNVVYRAGFAVSRNQARQLVNHGHITVNGRKVDIPSYQVKVGNVVGVGEGSKDMPVFKEAAAAYQREIMPWLQVDKKKLEAVVIERPTGMSPDVPIRDEMIVELYSR
jgi:small subunit ribosomal protein S4